jgi:hypothetical protein
MTLETRPGCRFVPLPDERPARTIGTITPRRKSSTRLPETFLTHLGAQARTDAA